MAPILNQVFIIASRQWDVNYNTYPSPPCFMKLQICPAVSFACVECITSFEKYNSLNTTTYVIESENKS